MTNQQFTEYLERRLAGLKKMVAADRPKDFEAQVPLLNQAHEIMTHGSGPARRRFRRDYERRLAFKLELKQEMERIKLVDGLVRQEVENGHN